MNDIFSPELLFKIDRTREEMQRVQIDLTWSHIPSEPYAHMQAKMLAEVLTYFAGVAHDEIVKHMLRDCAEELTERAQDLEQDEQESEREDDRFLASASGLRAIEQGYD